MTKSPTTYTAVCERDQDASVWVVTVEELPGVVTQGRNLAEARRMAVDAIALWLDVPHDAVSVAVEARVGSDADRVTAEAGDARASAESAQAEAAARLRDAVRVLIEEQGLTVRDAAELLGISYQRVAQLAPARKKVKAR